MFSKKIGDFESNIGYCFNNHNLLITALTHTSYLKTQSNCEDYDRLEFVGDRVLGLALSKILYEIFPDASSAKLARMFANLVCKEACCRVAINMGIPKFMRFGNKDVATAEAMQISLLADMCESVIGAVFIDSSFEAAKNVIDTYWLELIKDDKIQLADAKTRLQEWTQKNIGINPEYKIVNCAGPHHAPVFTVSINIKGYKSLVAHGNSRQKAEQEAAKSFIEQNLDTNS